MILNGDTAEKRRKEIDEIYKSSNILYCMDTGLKNSGSPTPLEIVKKRRSEALVAFKEDIVGITIPDNLIGEEKKTPEFREFYARMMPLIAQLEPGMAKVVKDYIEKESFTQEATKKRLMEMGIHDENGELTDNYKPAGYTL